jgi:beta-glucosidase-like glycosyl hydrolase
MHDLEAYYLAPFKAAMMDAGAGSVMCAYQGNLINMHACILPQLTCMLVFYLN